VFYPTGIVQFQTDIIFTISLEMPVPSQGHYGFHSFPVVESSVILLLPLLIYFNISILAQKNLNFAKK
jgi:hypothetical protein